MHRLLIECHIQAATSINIFGSLLSLNIKIDLKQMLPPFHEVSHEIPLIDESKQLKHRLPKCPEAIHSELA